MDPIKKNLPLMSALAIAILFLAACGGGDTSPLAALQAQRDSLKAVKGEVST